ncbi:MAG: AMP-binding protein [Spirochaetales bacterium]|nr:AMP-binding protein [Spirochaetales bacterium]
MDQLSKRTMNQFLVYLAKKHTNNDAVAYVGEEAFSYNDLIKSSYYFSQVLNSNGIKPGDKVALISENSPWWVFTYIAVVASGRTIVPILPDFSDEDVINIVKHSDAKAVVVSPKIYKRVLKQNKTFAPKFFCSEGFEQIPHKVANLSDFILDKKSYLDKFENFDLGAILEFFESVHIEEDDLCSLIYTSGTTGMSKGVMLSHKNILFDAILSTTVPPKKKINNTLSILPLAHTYECTLGMVAILYKGARINYLKRGLSISSLLSALRTVKPEMMFSVPLLIEKIYRKSVYQKFTSKKTTAKIYSTTAGRKILNRIAGIKLKKTFGGRLFFFGIGGAGVAADVEQFLREAKFPYAMGYGLTETAPLIVGCSFERSKFKSTGHLLPGIEVKIDNPDKETGEGEIIVKGDNVMLGYYKDKKKTKEIFTEDGYLRTGDLGILDGEYLYIKGRLKNMILGPSGENIYPEMIEAVINKFDFVEDSLVFQDPEKGLVAKIHINQDDLKAYMEKIKDQAVSWGKSAEDYLKHLQQSINTKLSSFSRVSQVVEQKEPFKKTPTNKIKRYLHDGLDKDGVDSAEEDEKTEGQ